IRACRRETDVSSIQTTAPESRPITFSAESSEISRGPQTSRQANGRGTPEAFVEPTASAENAYPNRGNDRTTRGLRASRPRAARDFGTLYRAAYPRQAK